MRAIISFLLKCVYWRSSCVFRLPEPLSTRPLFNDQGYVMVPGWPYSVQQGSWTWRFLTPWGRSLKVGFTRPGDLPEGSCTWNVRINSQKDFCRPGMDGEAGQTNSSVNALTISSQKPRWVIFSSLVQELLMFEERNLALSIWHQVNPQRTGQFFKIHGCHFETPCTHRDTTCLIPFQIWFWNTDEHHNR